VHLVVRAGTGTHLQGLATELNELGRRAGEGCVASSPACTCNKPSTATRVVAHSTGHLARQAPRLLAGWQSGGCLHLFQTTGAAPVMCWSAWRQGIACNVHCPISVLVLLYLHVPVSHQGLHSCSRQPAVNDRGPLEHAIDNCRGERAPVA
jgi:hypothetical protein